MRWPPNKTWTSTINKEGYRHFEVLRYGGKGDKRWVELFAIMNDKIILKIDWDELKTHSKWTTGWLQLPKEESAE